MERRVDAPTHASELHGFRRHDAGSVRLAVAPEWEADALALGLLEAGAFERLLAGASGPRGRAATAIVALPDRGECLHLRAVRHGGWLAALWGDRLLGLGRPFAEVRVNAALRAAGAPVPLPVLAVAERRGAFWRAAVATRHEPDTRDGIALLGAAPPAERVVQACAAAGRAVRALHDAGGRHRDLHVGNLIFREVPSVECVIVDLDKARRLAEVSPSARMAEIMRLYRSIVRRGLFGVLGDGGCTGFLEAYTAGDSGLHAALLAHLPRERRRLALHRLGWRRRRAA